MSKLVELTALIRGWRETFGEELTEKELRYKLEEFINEHKQKRLEQFFRSQTLLSRTGTIELEKLKLLTAAIDAEYGKEETGERVSTIIDAGEAEGGTGTTIGEFAEEKVPNGVSEKPVQGDGDVKRRTGRPRRATGVERS